MGIRYVFKDDMQVGIIYATADGIHIVNGAVLTKFFKGVDRMGDRELRFHDVDEDEVRFIELSKPTGSRKQTERMAEDLLVANGFRLSPGRF